MDDDNDTNTKKILVYGERNKHEISKQNGQYRSIPKQRKVHNKNQMSFDITSELTAELAIARLYVMYIREIFSLDELNQLELHMHKEVAAKVRGYVYQDTLKKFIREIGDHISVINVLEKLIYNRFTCHYCENKLLVLYQNVRDPLQWTMDRLDNKLGHTNDNCILSCLGCNISRRDINSAGFKYTKQLVICKDDTSNNHE